MNPDSAQLADVFSQAVELRGEERKAFLDRICAKTPSFRREVEKLPAAILRLRAPEVSDALARQVAGAVAALRELDLYKAPGVAETIDWAHAVAALGVATLDEGTVEVTLGTVLKYREDQERAIDHGLGALVAAAGARG